MPGGSCTLRLPPTRQAPSLARAAVRDCGDAWPVETLHAALIVVSELVTNAFVHGQGTITVAVECRFGAVAITVSDESPRGLMMLNHPADSDSGRGLAVVERLSSAWGVRPASEGPGKSVWVRLGEIATVS